ncbi:endonuclease/exonuclease/phosphatase family protein [Sphaerisporangium flaviroseum]|uniref:Endonuclease/exonuclease/phosphatase family protein n=1 Tax=Sphaerisporangium flaviroseum TaxID=509199 RepID=A0ABP7I3E0_9ACTN
MGIRALTVNIGNPSVARARRQLVWLARQDVDVLVLTETKASAGCELLREAFTRAGYHVTGAVPVGGGYGAMILSRLPVEVDTLTDAITYLPERVASIIVSTPAGPLRIAGVYVPSRDASPGKIERKQRFLDTFVVAAGKAAAEMPLVLLGDLNILEPDHRPRYGFFRPFEYDAYRGLVDGGLVDAFRHLHPSVDEYSWVGKTGDGYRYDHALVCTALARHVTSCVYVHACRTGPEAFTDHSGMALQLAHPAPGRLAVSDPMAQSQSGPDTLF